MKSWNTRSEIFTTMPLRSYFVFCLAVAFTFATIGVVNDLFDLEHTDARHLILKIVTTSGFSVLWVIALHRRMRRLLFAVIVVQVMWLIASPRFIPATHRVLTSSDWRTQVALHGLLIMALVLFSYGWFGTFFRMEGKRYYAAHTEIELASKIQQQLVPPIQMVTSDIEIHGISIPSGTVGGDLIDAVETNGTVCAYVADVAGHGVAAGVLMSMVKTAVRMHLTSSSPPGAGLLEAVNRTLTPLTDSSAYATFAYVLARPEMPITYALAGHLPIFHFQLRTGATQRRSTDNLPLAMFPDVTYETATVDLQPGDILAIVTDGLTEVFNSKKHELGDTYIENALARLASRSLSEIAADIFKSASAFGNATDDQTLLLLRRHVA